MLRRIVWDVLGALSGLAAAGLYGIYIGLVDTSDALDQLGLSGPDKEYIEPFDSAEMIAQVVIANRDDAQTAVYLGLASAFLFL